MENNVKDDCLSVHISERPQKVVSYEISVESGIFIILLLLHQGKQKADTQIAHKTLNGKAFSQS